MTGKKTLGYDCVIIPGAAKMTTPFPLIANQAFCGAGGLGYADASATATGGKTVCCKFFLSQSSVLQLFQAKDPLIKNYIYSISILSDKSVA